MRHNETLRHMVEAGLGNFVYMWDEGVMKSDSKMTPKFLAVGLMLPDS